MTLEGTVMGKAHPFLRVGFPEAEAFVSSLGRSE
jgi:hypothetical protein